MRPIKARSRKPMTAVGRRVDRVEELPRLGRIEHRRLAAAHDVEWPAHGGGRICRHNLARHHPIKQMPQSGEAKLCGRRGSRARQFLDVGGDVNALDRKRHGEWVRAMLARKPAKVVALALVNKTARIAWAIMKRGEAYVPRETFVVRAA
jgi:hypothetical protein